MTVTETTNRPTGADVLAEAQRILMGEGVWTKGSLFRPQREEGEVDQYCLMGAIDVAAERLTSGQADGAYVTYAPKRASWVYGAVASAIREALSEDGEGTAPTGRCSCGCGMDMRTGSVFASGEIAQWNNAEKRTLNQVLGVLGDAIVKAKEDEIVAPENPDPEPLRSYGGTPTIGETSFALSEFISAKVSTLLAGDFSRAWADSPIPVYYAPPGDVVGPIVWHASERPPDPGSYDVVSTIESGA